MMVGLRGETQVAIEVGLLQHIRDHLLDLYEGIRQYMLACEWLVTYSQGMQSKKIV